MFVWLAIGGGAVVAGLVAGHYARRKRPQPNPPQVRAQSALEVGHVILTLDKEYWLAGALGIEEDPAFRLFRAMAGAGDERESFILQVGLGIEEVFLLHASDAVPPGNVPAELRIDGTLHRLVRRGTAKLRFEGEHLPPAAKRGSFTWLTGAGDRAVFVLDLHEGSRVALVGEQLRPELLEILPGRREPSARPLNSSSS